MGKQLRLFLMLCSALAGAARVPAGAESTTYTLIIAYVGDTEATLARMNGEGDLSYVADFTVGFEPGWVQASPNGQAAALVTFSSSPQVTVAFLDPAGQIAEIAYVDKVGELGGGPAVLHPQLPILYAGYQVLRGLAIDYENHSLYDLGFAMDLGPFYSPELVFSPVLPGILCTNPRLSDVRGVLTAPDGTMTTLTLPVSVAPGKTYADLAVSPDGRWAVALGGTGPEISVLQIRRREAPALVQQIDLPYPDFLAVHRLRYTPDGQYAILILDGRGTRVASFRVDSLTGHLSLIDRVIADAWYIPQALAITPDGKYAVVMSPDIAGWGAPTVLHVIRIRDDGTLEWLQDKDTLVYGFPSDMEFVPPWRETYPAPQGMVVH